MHKTLISLDQMHQSYDKMLSEAEKRLEKIYESVKEGKKPLAPVDEESSGVSEEVKEEVVAILTEAMSNGAERIDLSERRLPFLPEAFGKIRTLVYPNLSSNQLEVIPDSVSGLENLKEPNVSSNILPKLPESIGYLHKLKILDVSSNKLDSLLDSNNQLTELPNRRSDDSQRARYQQQSAHVASKLPENPNRRRPNCRLSGYPSLTDSDVNRKVSISLDWNKQIDSN